MRDGEAFHGPLHARWVKDLSRSMDRPGYREEWRVEQCLSCVHYIPLDGTLGDDWGACANAASQFDRRVMFEHDGCAQHVASD